MSTADQLRIEVRTDGDHVVCALSGELDLSAREALERALDQALATGLHRVDLDLASLEFIDAGGLRIVEAAAARAVEDGREFMVRRPSKVTRRLLVLTDLEWLVDPIDRT